MPYIFVGISLQVVNILLRIAWMQLVLEFNLHPLHKMTVITTISCLEIIRRGIWNFFRYESRMGVIYVFSSKNHCMTQYGKDRFSSMKQGISAYL